MNDTSPVPVPKDALAVLRIKSAESILRSVRELSGSINIPEAITVQSLSELLLGPTLADVVDFSQPIDVGMSGDTTSPSFVISMPLVSLSDANQNLSEDFTLTPREGGVIRLNPHKKASASKVQCELRPAAGPSPFRLVCAMAPYEPGAMGAYLARTVARSPLTSEVRVEAFAQPLFQKELGKFDVKDASDVWAKKVLTQIVGDIEALSLDLSTSPNAIDMTFGSTFARGDSPLTRLLASQSKPASAIPDLFWRLPADSKAAFYSAGSSPQDLEGMRGWTREMLEAIEDDDGAPTAVRDRVIKVTQSVLFTGGPLVAAYGLDDAASLTALKKTPAKAKVDRHIFQGWTLFGVEEPQARWVDAFREVIAIDKVEYKHKAKPQKDKDKDEDEDEGDDVKEPKKKKKDKTGTIFTETPLSAASKKALPAGTAHFLSTAYKKAGEVLDKKKPVSVTHIFIVASDNRTWLAMGENEAQLVTRVRSVLAQADADKSLKTLKTRTDLQALRAPTNLGGFVTLGLFDAFGLPDEVGAAPNEDRQKAETKLTHAGTPLASIAIPFFVPPQGGEAGGTSASTNGAKSFDLRFHVPKTVFGDVVTQAQASP